MPWQELLGSCVSETNPVRLERLVFETEDAIFLRSQELSKETRNNGELQALKQAATVLLEIKTNKLGWPDPFEMNIELNDLDKPNVTLAGTVQKIIPPVNGDPEKVQIRREAGKVETGYRCGCND